MGDERDRLLWAVGSYELWRTPTRVRAALPAGRDAAVMLAALGPAARQRVVDTVDTLLANGIGVLYLNEASYPPRLALVDDPPPVLFYIGNVDLLKRPAVGMCGSRDASERGLEAARGCGEQVARHGLTVVSGYARGVDMATHVGAIAAGGSTIIVMAEGLIHFRMKRDLADTGADFARVLVLSQFPPRQTWNTGAAMARNAVIVGLGRALVVVEARDKGGTLDAGLQALRLGRPLLALEFSDIAPKGNALLFEKGAQRVSTTGELKRALDAIGEPGRNTPVQLTMSV